MPVTFDPKAWLSKPQFDELIRIGLKKGFYYRLFRNNDENYGPKSIKELQLDREIAGQLPEPHRLGWWKRMRLPRVRPLT